MTSQGKKQKIRQITEEVEELDLPDGAYWCLIHERLNMEYGDVFSVIAEDPKFFGFEEMERAND